MNFHSRGNGKAPDRDEAAAALEHGTTTPFEFLVDSRVHSTLPGESCVVFPDVFLR